MLDGEENSDEDSLLYSFSLIQNLRTVLVCSPEKRSVSFFVHTKEEGNPPKPHVPKKHFDPLFL